MVVKCEACGEATLVAFSCKGRGWCPSCGARRAHETALHLNEVLPAVAYRQWTLSLPGVLRWLVVTDTKLLRAMERCLVRSIFRWQRLRARRLGASGKKTGGAVSFTQLFGSALQLTPHLHVLVPEGVWSDGVFVELPPPTTEGVEAVLARTVRQLAPLFESREAPWPEDEFEALQARGTQLKLLLPEEPQPGRRGLLAVAMGLSLHADTWVHGNDRAGLLRLCRYGARGPVAESRLKSTRRRPVCVRDKARSDAGDDGGAARAQIAVADSTARPASDELPWRAGRALRAARAGGSEADDARTAAPVAAAGEEAAASENRPFDRLRATLLHRTFGCCCTAEPTAITAVSRLSGDHRTRPISTTRFGGRAEGLTVLREPVGNFVVVREPSVALNRSAPPDIAAVAPGHCVSSRPLVPVAATSS